VFWIPISFHLDPPVNSFVYISRLEKRANIQALSVIELLPGFVSQIRKPCLHIDFFPSLVFELTLPNVQVEICIFSVWLVRKCVFLSSHSIQIPSSCLDFVLTKRYLHLPLTRPLTGETISGEPAYSRRCSPSLLLVSTLISKTDQREHACSKRRTPSLLLKEPLV